MVSATSLARALQLGISTGIRSVTPIAAVASTTSQGGFDLPEVPPFSLLARKEVSYGLLFCAVGEAVADKIAPLPPRSAPLALIPRMAFGAMAAGIAAAGEGESVPLATGLGAIGAAWGSFAATGARGALVNAGIPDVMVGLLEDVLAVSLTVAALPSLRLGVL